VQPSVRMEGASGKHTRCQPGFKGLPEGHAVKVRFYLWAVKSKLLGSSGLMLAVKLLGAASAYALAWLVGRGEGPEAYGQFELGLTVLTMAAMFSRLGLDAVMVKWLAATRVDGHVGVQRTLARRASMWVLGASLLLAGSVWWSTTQLQESLGGDEGLWTAVAWGVPAMALWGLASEMLRGLGRMAGYASVQQGVLTALAVALMLSLGLDVVSAFGAALLVVGVAAAAHVAWSLPKGSKAIDMPASYRGSAMLSTGWPMLLGSAMFLVMSWTDTLLLGHFLDEAEVGVYRVAFRLAAVITLVQAAVNSYAAPWFAERHAVGDDAGLRQALAQTTGLNVAFSVPAFLALAVAPAWWMGWFGPAFESGAMCLLCLALGQLVNALCGPVMYLLNMTGHERVAQRIVWVAALLNLALNVWAIPRFGILGAAASTAATMVLWNVAAAVAVHRRLGLSVWTVLRSFAQRNKA